MKVVCSKLQSICMNSSNKILWRSCTCALFQFGREDKGRETLPWPLLWAKSAPLFRSMVLSTVGMSGLMSTQNIQNKPTWRCALLSNTQRPQVMQRYMEPSDQKTQEMSELKYSDDRGDGGLDARSLKLSPDCQFTVTVLSGTISAVSHTHSWLPWLKFSGPDFYPKPMSKFISRPVCSEIQMPTSNVPLNVKAEFIY